MDNLVRLGFAIALLLVTLFVAIGFMAVPLMILRRTGAMRVIRWVIRTSWRMVVGLVRIPIRILNSRRRGRARRAIPLTRAFVRLFK